MWWAISCLMVLPLPRWERRLTGSPGSYIKNAECRELGSQDVSLVHGRQIRLSFVQACVCIFLLYLKVKPWPLREFTNAIHPITARITVLYYYYHQSTACNNFFDSTFAMKLNKPWRVDSSKRAQLTQGDPVTWPGNNAGNFCVITMNQHCRIQNPPASRRVVAQMPLNQTFQSHNTKWLLGFSGFINALMYT